MSNNLVLIYHLHWHGYPLFRPWSLVKQSNKQLLSFPPFPVRHSARHPAHGTGPRITIYINLNICVVDSSQLPLYPGSSCRSDQRGFRPICFPRISDPPHPLLWISGKWHCSLALPSLQWRSASAAPRLTDVANFAEPTKSALTDNNGLLRISIRITEEMCTTVW